MNLLFKSIIKSVRSYQLILMLLILGSFSSYGQNLISVPFNEGFVGDNTANNVSSNSKYLSALGWTNVQFTQNSPVFIFVAQGNDIPGTVLITDNLGIEYSIPGYIKWRAPSGNNITTPVFVPTTGATLATNSSNGSATYSITTTSYIGLTFNGQALTIPTTSSGGTTAGDVTGNAATSGILDALNAYLGSFPAISVKDYFVVENIGTKVITVTLSTTSTQIVTVNFNTSNNTAISGSDYNAQTGTLTFAAGETSKTITLTITDDSATEINETFYLQLADPTNASILDASGTITIIDNDGAVGICDPNRKYDKIVSGYHSSIALSADGTYLAWGQAIASSGTTDVAPPLVMNSTNYSTLTGTVLFTSIGGIGSGGKDQFVALTTTGLWAWGFQGGVFSTGLTTGTAFNKINTPTGGDSTTKLPIGVAPTNVTMLVACHQTLLLVANGNVWVLTQASANIQGDNSALSATTWHKVKIDASTDLTNVISVRGQVSSATLNAIMALTAEGNVYTWGNSTYLGNAAAATAKTFATLMTLPAEFNTTNKPKMIGVTGGVKVTTTTKNTLYVLSSSGSLYSLGDNTKKQCGDFTSTERLSWINVKSNATTNFTNINFISCQEHTAGMPGVAAITVDSKLYSWGENDGLMLGQITDGAFYDPTVPQGFTVGTDKAIFTELGGHTLVYVKEGSTKFCYVGHRTNGSMGESTTTTGNVVAFDCNNTPTINLCGSVSVAASTTNSTISANPISILANGSSTSTITIQLKDTLGANLTSTGGNVNITTTAGTITNIIDNNDGTYTATLTSSNTVETATISYTINGSAGTNTATVNFTAVASSSAITTTGTLTAFSACSGSVSSQQSFTVSGTALTADLVVTAPTGYEISLTTGSGFASSLTLTQTGGTVATTTIYVRLATTAINGAAGDITCTSTGATTQNVATVAAVVSPLSNAGSISGTATVCSGTNSTVLTLSGYTGAIQWQSSTNNVTFTNIASATADTYTAANLAATTYYKAVVTSGSCASATSAAATMTVTTTPSVANTTATICTGQTFTVAPTNGSGNVVPTGTVYTWTVVDNANVTGESTVSSTQSQISQTLTNTSTSNQTVTYTVTPKNPGAGSSYSVGSTYNGGVIAYVFQPTDNGYAPGKVLIVKDNFVPGVLCGPYKGWAMSSASASTSDLIGEGLNNTNNLYNAGHTSTSQAIGYIYNYSDGTYSDWFAPSINELTTIFNNVYSSIPTYSQNPYAYRSSTEIPTSLGQTYALGKNSNNIGYNSFTQNDGGCGMVILSRYDTLPTPPPACDGTPFTVTVTVNPTSIAGTISGATTVCSGTNSTVLTLAGNTGTIQWQSSTDNVTFTNISTATGQTFTATNLTATTYYRAVVTSGLCASATTSSVTVNVDATSVAGTISGATTLCSGTNSTVLTLSGNRGTVQWQSSTDNITFTNISSETGLTYTATNLTATTYYKVVVTNGVCSSATTSAATITVTPLPISAAGNNATICKGSTYTTNGVATNGTVGWVTSGTGTFSDATSINTTYTPSQADIDAGSAFLTMVVYGTGTCSSEYTYSGFTLTIVSVPVATADAGPATDSICSGSVYSIAGTSTDGTILWTTSGSGSFSNNAIDSPIYTPSATDITAGSVTLTMTVTSVAVGSCPAHAPATDTVVLSIATPPTADAGSTTDDVCAGSNYTLTGSATHGSILWTTSGTGTFSDATIATPVYTPSASDLTNGSATLTITVTGTGGCSTTSDAIQLAFIPAPTADAGLATDSICSDSTYTTTATATVGATISWSTSGTGTFANGSSLDAVYTPSATDITAGSVTLTMSVTGTGVCAGVTVTDSLILTISPAPTSNAGPATDSICVGSTYTPAATASNGTILWTTTGTGTFSNATVATPVYTPSSADITSGTVSLTMTVSGSGACASSTVSDTVILTITTQPTSNAGPATAHICAGSTYTLSGISSNGSILWTSSGTGTFNTATINTPIYTPSAADITAGTVTLTMTVTGTGGCSSATAVDTVILTVFKVTNVTSQINVSCNGGNNGTASVTPSGGTSPYTYSWSPSGGTLYSAVNLAAGNYSCLVTDANGCTATSSFTITQPVILAATTTQVNASTFSGIDGSATVTVSGGTSPYIYSWSPLGGSAATASNLGAGTYTCTITDSNGCSITKSVTITQPSAFLATTSQVNILCNGVATGSATVSVSGGVSPITYSWSPSGGTSATASNLAAGTYTCTITDGSSASIIKTFTITQPALLSGTTSQTNVAINGNATGSASVIVSGGNSPYAYTWSPSVGTTATVNGIVAGLYSCTITDANGCSITKTITITQPTVLASTVSQTNVNCNGSTTGSATMSITGGVIPYAYSWTPSVSTGATANNLAAGTYSCTATDANGAIQTRTFTITQPTLLTATTSQTNVGCNGASTGAASVLVSGGTSGYTYSWSPSGGTGATASNLVAGSYTCTITDANGCTLTKTFTITQPTALTATTSQTNVAIFGTSTGTASVVVSGGVLSYTYAWLPSGGTGATASNLAAGTYTCTITDANGCTLTKTFTITQSSSLLATTSQTNILCNGASTGAASVSVSGGSLSYTYLWSPSGGTLSSASNLVAGVYTCSITDTNGAILVKTFTITQPTLLSATVSQTNVAINGGTTGVATVSVTGGTTGYTYAWSPSGGTGATASNLVAGTYTCTITDANGCTVVKSFTITQPSALTATTSQTNVLCNAATTGATNVSVSGGVSPYSYSWSPSVGAGASLNGLSAGTYVCTITDANGASIVKTFVITQPSALTATTSQTNVTCNAGTNATASVVVSGGTSAYTYLWSPTGGTTATASGLTAGAYTCTVTDANGCSIQKAFTVTQPTALTATTTQTNVAISGASTGAATVVAAGGTAAYTYSWSPSGGSAATASNLAAGTYTCTITDANGCTVTKTFTITQPTALTATTSQVNVVCNGLATGSASVVASGAVSPYTYSWSPSGGSGATASSLLAGTYTCTITDANGAVIMKTVTITQASALTATTSQTNVSCNAGVNGSASVVVSGSNAPYTYSWSPSGGLAATVNNLAVGTYTCTITDVNGCSITKTVTIIQPTALVATTSQTNVSCNGGTSGVASVSVSGGASGYTYSWSPSGGTAATASNLVAGSYTCTITDANGCNLTKSFTITQPTLLTATTSQTNVGCNGASTGAASVLVSGGTSGYTYSWSPSGGTGATASNLVAGSYTCTITDANGCTLTKTFTITQPTALTATTSQTNVAIFGTSTGTASVVVSGGVLSYTYAWLPSGGTGATASNLAAGTYTCTITDANGCTLTKTFTITQSSSLLATTSQTNILCNGASTGAASVSVSGGSLSYTYLWSPSGGTLSSASNLVAGVYTCSITDTNGAILVKTFTITQPTLLSATVSQTNVAINGGTTGVATVSVTGGTTGYTYAWSPSGGTGATASNLAAGTYTCTITDANGCTVTKSFTITQPSALTATTSQTNVLCNGATTGATNVSVSGGVSPYSYSWSPSVGAGASLNGLSAGTYVCTITDANGASIVKTFVITQPSALTATTSQTNVTCNAGTNATASVVVSGGTSAYTYLWSPTGGATATASGLTAGAYTCTVTDANGCSIQKAFTVTQPTALTAATTQTNVAINGASTGAATVVAAGGTAAYTYSWSPSGGSAATASNLAAGTYTCTITDANGCTVTKTFTITQPTALTATTSQVNVVCNGLATGSASVVASGAVSPYTYSWSPSGGSGATASSLLAGTYTCTITDANGAVITKTVTITQGAVIPLPIANAGPATDSICSGGTFTAAGTASNGTVLWTTSGSGTFNNASLVNAVYTPSAADSATGSVVLTMTVTAPGACNIPSASDTLALTIYPTSNAGIIAGATTVCQGTNSTTLTLSEYTGTIQWQVSTNNIVFNNIALATSPVFTATNLVATTYYRAIVTSGVCSSATTATATITVSSTSVAGTIAGATPVCYGTNSTALTLSGNLGNIQWQSSTDNSTFTAIAGATSSVYTASNLNTTTYFRAVSTNGVCSSATATATIVVNPLPISNAGPATATICAGTTYTTSGIATNGTALWTTSGTGTFANASNAVTIYTPSSADQTNGSVVLTMTVTGNANGCTSNTTTDAIILAINSPSAPVAVANQNYCYLINPTVANLTTTSGTNVKWYSVATGGTALNTTSPLVTATTYYATQTVSGCESITRTAVLVTLTCSVNAVVDTFNSINGYTGGTTASVLNNDLMNGTPLVSSNVILTGITVPTGFTFNANGTITVPPSTPAGNYLVTYSICEVLNPLNCSQAVATVVVAPPVIDAVVDNYGPMNGFQGSTTTSVLGNDLLNGVLVSQSEITLTVISIPTGLVMNPNGTITVLPGTPPGIYVVNYLISENLNPTNLDQVSAVVTVVDCLTFPLNDCDGDGVTNGQELLDGTNPSDSCSMNFAHQTVATTAIWNNLDCDGDGVLNGREILDGTNPTDLCSFVLANQTLTTNANWNNSDCDGDGVRNGQEMLDGTNPLLPCSFNPIHISSVTSTAWNASDCDGDGVTNGQEMLDGTNPVDLCSLNPTHITAVTSTIWNNSDCDGDGVTNGQEIIDGTNPKDSCSLNLTHQTVATSTAWNNSDCDGDGVKNGQELLDGTSPLDLCSLNPAHQTVATSTVWNNSDCDGDGVSNNQETVDNTDILDPCSLIVAHQTLTPSTAWLSSDCDGDGVTNGQEIADGTDVNIACDSNPIHVTLPLSQAFLDGDCDNDGLLNGEEIGANPATPNDFDNNNIPDYLEFNNHATSEDDLEIYNVVTPNGNGDNDVFVIRNIQLYPNNTVTIFNRWGVIVYDVDSYGQDNNFFKGVSEGRSTMRKLEELPIGTYFYTIRYVNSQGVQKERSGYLYLNK